jgi:diguanylate cyclase (GGDEF)-like protein
VLYFLFLTILGCFDRRFATAIWSGLAGAGSPLEVEALMQDPAIDSWGQLKFEHLYSKLAVIFLVALVYFGAGKLGLQLAFVNPSATAVWPPTGIALAAFLLLGGYIWPGILLGAFLVNFTTSGSVPSSLMIAAGNTLEGLAGAYLIQNFANGVRVFRRAQDVFKFVALVALISTPISATIGTTSLILNKLAASSDYLTIWSTWWMGDIGGGLIIAPAVILWIKNPAIRWTPAQAIEAAFLFLSLILLGVTVFSGAFSFAEKKYPLEFAFMPLVIWVALRFGRRESATATLVLSGIAILGTLQGFGPFARDLPNESLLLLQGFMDVMAVTGLSLAALVFERQETGTALQESNSKLSQTLAGMEKYNRKINSLTEMGDLLHSCSTIEEAYVIIGQLAQQLFTEESGALYIINDSQTMVRAAVTWGDPPPQAGEFALEDCWALRRGRVHTLNENGLALLCPHLKSDPPHASICVPLMAQSETIGILNLQIGRAGEDGPGRPERHLAETQQWLARAMADTTALALANLKMRASLRQQSIRDPLTDLFNRRYLEETLERELYRAARVESSIGVVMLDLDHFKNFNDRFGHEAGDTLLRALSDLLRKHIRISDIACRYGGEEFALILPEISLQDVRDRAEKLREEAKDLHVEYRGETLESITLSLGIAMFPEHGATGNALLHAADAALYEAKRMGRDRVIVAEAATESPDQE